MRRMKVEIAEGGCNDHYYGLMGRTGGGGEEAGMTTDDVHSRLTAILVAVVYIFIFTGVTAITASVIYTRLTSGQIQVQCK
jgi:hypothetical protein